MRSKFIFTFFCTLLIIVFAEGASAQQVFFANLSGRQVVPANNSTGSAFCKLTPSAQETGVSFTCNYNLHRWALNEASNAGYAVSNLNLEIRLKAE